MGGSAEATANLLEQRYGDNPALPDALRLAVDVLSEAGPSPRQLPANQLEVAVLDRTRPKRKFQRLLGAKLDALLATTGSGKRPAEGKDGKVSGAAAGDAGAGGAEAGTGAGAVAGAEAGPAEGATDTGPGEPPPDRFSGPDTPPAGTGD
jgi:proteasome alpha subunit